MLWNNKKLFYFLANLLLLQFLDVSGLRLLKSFNCAIMQTLCLSYESWYIFWLYTCLFFCLSFLFLFLFVNHFAPSYFVLMFTASFKPNIHVSKKILYIRIPI